MICGLHTDTCDRHTAADAFLRGYRLVVPEDCVQAFTDEAHSSGLEYLKKVYGARVVRSEDLVIKWGATAAVHQAVRRRRPSLGRVPGGRPNSLPPTRKLSSAPCAAAGRRTIRCNRCATLSNPTEHAEHARASTFGFGLDERD